MAGRYLFLQMCSESGNESRPFSPCRLLVLKATLLCVLAVGIGLCYSRWELPIGLCWGGRICRHLCYGLALQRLESRW